MQFLKNNISLQNCLHIYRTSGLPGQRLVTPRACGARRCSIHRCTARLELATVVPRALARCRFLKSDHRPARVAAIGPCRSHTSGQCRRAREARAASALAPVPLLKQIFVEIGNFAPFSVFLHIKGRNFLDVFYPFMSTYDPYEPWKVLWKSVCTFFKNPEDRHTDGQTEAALYIYRRT